MRPYLLPLVLWQGSACISAALSHRPFQHAQERQYSWLAMALQALQLVVLVAPLWAPQGWSAEKNGYRHSYDMLGEAARTTGDALKYFETYVAAIKVIGAAAQGRPALEAPSVSIKLSALHPRYEVANEERVRRELWPAVKALALQAKRMNIGFTIDAEEMDRLEISLDLIEALALDHELAGWDGLGVALQSYQKRALATVDWLADLAHRARRRLMVRLVKGAYWDAEIKLAQERGLTDYPVFTRKASTDVSYLACARRLFADPVAFYPAFATHNAHTLAAVAEMAATAGCDFLIT